MPKIDISPDAGDCHLEAGIVVVVVNQGRVSRVISDSDNDLQYIVIDEGDPNGLPEAGVAEARERGGDGDLTDIAAKVNCNYCNARIIDAHNIGAPRRLALIRNSEGSLCVVDWAHMKRCAWTSRADETIKTMEDFASFADFVPDDEELEYDLEESELHRYTLVDGEKR